MSENDNLPPESDATDNVIKLDAKTVDNLPIWLKTPPRLDDGFRLCGLAHCNRAHFSQNLCNPHYQLARLGNLDPTSGLSKSQIAANKRAIEKRVQADYSITPETEFVGFGKLKDWVYIAQTQEFINTNDFAHMNLSAARQIIGPVVLTLIRNEKVKVYRRQYFEPYRERLDEPEDWTPKKEEDFNAFRPELVMGIKDHAVTMPSELYQLLWNLSGQGKHQRYLEQWLSYTVRNYGEAGCALILHGVHGSGKSVFSELLARIFGPYMGTVTTQDIEEKHNSWLENKLVICAEELMSGTFRDKLKMMNLMKKFVSGGKMFINRKMVPQYEYNNQARWIVFSNAGAAGNESAVPVVIEPTERRYSLIKCMKPLSKEIGYNISQNVPYFAQALVNYLSTVDMTGFVNWQCYENEDLHEAKALSERLLK